ncbi:hypothetical protein AusDCA_3957 [Desulfitobacterium sp. AusDCA]
MNKHRKRALVNRPFSFYVKDFLMYIKKLPDKQYIEIIGTVNAVSMGLITWFGMINTFDDIWLFLPFSIFTSLTSK